MVPGVAHSRANEAPPQGGSQRSSSTTKPNIVFIISDQHRAGLTKRSGYSLDASPTLDGLAESGIGFDRAYTAGPLCMPSRITMLTGRWPEAHRVRTNFISETAFYEKHLYQVAKELGYKTGLVGKNHTFLIPEEDLDFYRPELWMPPKPPKEYVEYEHWLGVLFSNISLQPTPFPVEVQGPYRLVSSAMDFMDGVGSQPFILQVSFVEPHDPEEISAPYWNMFPPEDLPERCAGPEALAVLGFRAQWLYGVEQRGTPPSEANWHRYKSNYLGMLRMLDDPLARLLAHMRQEDLLKNTIIVYLADHGDYLMDYGLARKGVGLPECLVRVPMVWSGWGIQPKSAAGSAFVSTADLMPTICEAKGAPIPHGVQGRSLWPLLQGEEVPQGEFRSIYSGVGLGGLYYDRSDDVPYSITEYPATANRMPGYDEINKVTQSGNQKMLRMGDWKLIYDMMGYGQLYHLTSDPCELKNLFGDPSVAHQQAELMAELAMWTIRCQDSLPAYFEHEKYVTKWASVHNWYVPYRHGIAPKPFIP
jgi:arylsulfatase A-like enzyme